MRFGKVQLRISSTVGVWLAEDSESRNSLVSRRLGDRELQMALPAMHLVI